MPSPSSSAYLRPDLGQSFEEFDLAAELQGFVAPMVLPIFDTGVQNANFGKVPAEELAKDQETDRAPGAGYNRSEVEFEQDNFTTRELGAEEPLDDRQRVIYAHAIDGEMVAANRSRNLVLRDLERKTAAAVFNATTWTGASLTTGVNTEWSNSANATPIDDVTAAIQKVRESGGCMPNALIINWEVFKNLRNCDEIVDRVKYAGLMDPATRQVTAAALAQVLGIDEVIVAGALRNTANEGQAATFADIWSKEYAMVAKIAKTKDLKEVCIGRIFHFIGDGSSPSTTIEMYRDESKRSDVFRARMDVQAKIIYPQAGHLLSNITA